jgi:ubiquinone/menaquinone biosynthesis C-methylase UbiE
MIVSREKCYICGKIGNFTIIDGAVLYREAVCEHCGASLRNSDTAKIVVQTLLNIDSSLHEVANQLNDFKILGTSSNGAIHSALKHLPGYVTGEYFEDTKSGEYKNNIMCIDLTASYFVDNYFDIVISEDVLEHIDDINLAFQEINRILKLKGSHVFTVPLHENDRTIDRSHLRNKIFHGDPVRAEGALVYTDFGQDIETILTGFGMRSERFVLHKFYQPEEITNVDTEYERYCALRNQPLLFYKYNSIVFRSIKEEHLRVVAKKTDQSGSFTGERFIPGISAEISGEHLQRYYAVSELIKDKIVVDAACGEGYGSFILSRQAKQVWAVDIDEDSITRARQKYPASNINFLQASIERLPLADNSADVVVSFETVEHVTPEPQCKFLGEVKRVLKPDGILIISTPDKKNYADKLKYQNSFHCREFYFREFQTFLKQWFSHVVFYNQGFETVCLITPEAQSESKLRFINQAEAWKINKKYILAICGNREIDNQDTLPSLYWQNGLGYERGLAAMTQIHEHCCELQDDIAKLKRQISKQSKIIKQYLLDNLKEKKIVCFGTGSSAKRILEQLPLPVAYFVDNDRQKWGSLFARALIRSPQELAAENKDRLAIIVASQYFAEIGEQLSNMGFNENIHYWDGYGIFLRPID